jgi:hypothetical protein
MMIFLVLVYRCIVSFAATNDLTRSGNDPLATISKVFFYLAQLPLELAICWDHAITDYRAVVDAGARGDAQREKLEIGKKSRKWKWKRWTTCLKNPVISKVLPFKRRHRVLNSDSASDIIPLMRTETPIRPQTTTVVSNNVGDVEKQSILPFPSTFSASSRSSTLGSGSIDMFSPYPMGERERLQRLSSPRPLLVEDVHTWTPRRSIWNL